MLNEKKAVNEQEIELKFRSKTKNLNTCSIIICPIRVIMGWTNVHVLAISTKNARSSIIELAIVVRNAAISMKMQGASDRLKSIHTEW